MSLVGRIQSGHLVDLGNVRLVGSRRTTCGGFFKIRFDDDGKTVWMMPQDVIDNSIRAFSVRDARQRLRQAATCRQAAIRAGQRPRLHRDRRASDRQR